MPANDWTYADNCHAFVQGWGVFDNTSYGTRVERVDDMEEITGIAGALPIFACDADALAHVEGEAERGSEFHKRALAHIAACKPV